MNGAVVIDALTGASAGAITAVLAARCLAQGCDPVQAMTASWVDLPDIHHLKTHEHTSPLSAKVLGDGARQLLGSGAGGLAQNPAKAQAGDVRVVLTMTSLEGYRYEIKKLEGDTTVDAVTYVDWADFRFSQASPDKDWLDAADAALASAANAVGFPPKLVKRSAADIAKAKAQGVKNPPNPDGVWYTDGGTVDNEPVGRLLDLLGDDDAGDGAERLVLLVHPNPTSTPAATTWVDPTQQPRWTRTGLRAQKVRGVQSIYDDLRTLEKTNTRLEWTRSTVEQIADAVEQVTSDADRVALAKALRDIVDGLHQKHTALNGAINRPPPDPNPPPDDATLADLLAAAVQRATGLEGKHPVKVEVVTPDLDDSGKPADELLAGEKLGHFFGFLDPKFRRSDFALGYRNMTRFLGQCLPRYGVGAEIDAALPEVQARYDQLGWDGERWGGAGWGTLSNAEKARLLELGGHVAWLVQDDIRHWGEGLPVDAN
jgi:hypothetical protein